MRMRVGGVTEDDQTSGRRAGQAATGATAAGASRRPTARAISVAWQLSVALTLAATPLPLPRRACLICISTSSTLAAFVPGFHWAVYFLLGGGCSRASLDVEYCFPSPTQKALRSGKLQGCLTWLFTGAFARTRHEKHRVMHIS